MKTLLERDRFIIGWSEIWGFSFRRITPAILVFRVGKLIVGVYRGEKL